MQPPFIVLDGPDGSGTTRHAALLCERLQREGYRVHATAEPSAGPVGRGIRTFLQEGTLPPDALQLLFTADRADHVHREVLPAIARGETVVSDRYLHSTLAYGEAQGLPLPWLQQMNAAFPAPSLVIFTLPPLAVCRQRLAKREARDSLEGDALQGAVYDRYRAFAERDPSIVVVDTSGTKESAHEEVWNAVLPLLSA